MGDRGKGAAPVRRSPGSARRGNRDRQSERLRAEERCDESEEDGATRSTPLPEQQPNPLIFIIPGGAVLLLLLFFAAGSGGGSTRPRDYRSRGVRREGRPGTGRHHEREPTQGERTLARGKAALARAQAMPIGPERDRAYHAAAAIFATARRQLERDGLDAMAVEANSHRYSCMKYATE